MFLEQTGFRHLIHLEQFGYLFILTLPGLHKLIAAPNQFPDMAKFLYVFGFSKLLLISFSLRCFLIFPETGQIIFLLFQFLLLDAQLFIHFLNDKQPGLLPEPCKISQISLFFLLIFLCLMFQNRQHPVVLTL